MPTLMLSKNFIDEHAERLAQIEKANNTTFELVRLDPKLVYLPDEIASRIDAGFLSRDIRFGSIFPEEPSLRTVDSAQANGPLAKTEDCPLCSWR